MRPTENVMTNEHSVIDPIEGYDLRKYRHAVAKYIKLLIRARATSEPTFLTTEEFDRWHLSDIEDEAYTAEQLLRLAAAAHDYLWQTFIGPNGSGGVAEDDPRGEFKQAVVTFTLAEPHVALLDSLRAGNAIDWSAAAEWNLLGTIRDGLDDLPAAGTATEESNSDCPVKILDAQQRTVEVLGQMKKLTAARLAVVEALIAQFPGTFTKDELVMQSKREGAVNVLKGLRESDAVWETVIKLAGRAGGGYGLVKPNGD